MKPNSAQIAALRRQLAVDTVFGAERQVQRLDIEEIDAALPWQGLPCGCLHEIWGHESDGAATGFCTMLLARLSAGKRPVLWVCENDDLYGPGLAALGLSLDQLFLVRARRPVEIMWTLEEALRRRDLAAVLGEIREATLNASRRLQLVARASGVTALLLRHQATAAAPVSTAVTRWRVTAAPTPPCHTGEEANTRWRVELMRCRGRIHREDGNVASWLVEWRPATGSLGVVSEFRDRPALPAEIRMAR